jgi:hypothetical protein
MLRPGQAITQSLRKLASQSVVDSHSYNVSSILVLFPWGLDFPRPSFLCLSQLPHDPESWSWVGCGGQMTLLLRVWQTQFGCLKQYPIIASSLTSVPEEMASSLSFYRVCDWTKENNMSCDNHQGICYQWPENMLWNVLKWPLREIRRDKNPVLHMYLAPFLEVQNGFHFP